MVISGSPRNSLRASVGRIAIGGKGLIGLGVLTSYQTLSNSEYQLPSPGSQTTGDKLRGREGNSPEYRLRSQIIS